MAADQVAGNSVEVTGFHAKRCEFDPEYDQEAECIVADLEFQEDEPEDDLQARMLQLTVFSASQLFPVILFSSVMLTIDMNQPHLLELEVQGVL